jgi:hypothetical protein
MSNSPVPEPPAPPLNPHCARCRFTSTISAATSNGTIHRQVQTTGSNPHVHQGNVNYVASVPGAANAFTGKYILTLLFFTQQILSSAIIIIFIVIILFRLSDMHGKKKHEQSY